MNKKIYISGPITGCKNSNRDAFEFASRRIYLNGATPINPFTVCADVPDGSPWRVYMRECLRGELDADKVLMLKGWRRSRGARVEWILAKLLGIKVIYRVEGI